MDHLLHFRINEAVGDHFLIAFVVEQRFHALERHFAAETTQNISYLLIGNMMADQAIQFAAT